MKTMGNDLVLAERVTQLNRENVRRLIEARLRTLSSGLEIAIELEAIPANGFVRIAVEGPDTEVFTELVKRKVGLAPSRLSDIEVNDNFRAYVSKIDSAQQSIRIELGPTSKDLRSEITREALSAQLCDGRAVPVDKVAQTYCLQEGVPVFVRVTCIDPDRGRIEAWVSDDQVSRFDEWRRQRLHRIIAVGGFQEKLQEAVRLSKVERDVADVEQLAWTSHSLVCKLGTDAPGIIAKIGRYLSDVRLYAFVPQKVDKLRFSFA